MDFSNLNLLSGLEQRMRFLSARSSVIAQNIANANTPGYVAKDIQPPRFDRLVSNTIRMRTTKDGHMATSNAGASTTTPSRAQSNEQSLTGNTVSIETETMKLAQTRMAYGLASTVYRKGLDMLRLAIRADR